LQKPKGTTAEITAGAQNGDILLLEGHLGGTARRRQIHLDDISL
jgi:hypothetical protein